MQKLRGCPKTSRRVSTFLKPNQYYLVITYTPLRSCAGLCDGRITAQNQTVPGLTLQMAPPTPLQPVLFWGAVMTTISAMWLHTMEGVQDQSEAVHETHSLSRLQGPFFACPKLWCLL